MPPLVSEGLVLAAYGMGTVFVFLTMLVLITMLMSWLVSVYADEPALTAEPPSQAKKLAAITAAIHQHRQKQ